VGHRWSPHFNQMRDFLARNSIPYQLLDAETDETARQLMGSSGTDSNSCRWLSFRTARISGPDGGRCGREAGVEDQSRSCVLMIWSLSEAVRPVWRRVYGAADGLRTVLIEREAPGGQAGRSFPNEITSASDRALADLICTAGGQPGPAVWGGDSFAARSDRGAGGWPSRFVPLGNGTEIGCRALLIATGIAFASGRAGREEFERRGSLLLRAMTEALSYKNEDVYIVGGANSAARRDVFFQIAPECDDVGARRFAFGEHVAVFGRPDWGDQDSW